MLDGPAGNDPSLRPNAVLAIALRYRAFDVQQERAILASAQDALVTSLCLRSLANRDPDYIGHYGGTQTERDGAYHRGTAWTWLLGSFAIAYRRATGDAATARSFLEPLGDALGSYSLGTLPEIADGDTPHAPAGCIAQAWSVAETLRAWHELAAPEKNGGA